jgi:hypothetical protein
VKKSLYDQHRQVMQIVLWGRLVTTPVQIRFWRNGLLD